MKRNKSLADYYEKLKNEENDRITLCFNLKRKKDRVAYQKVLSYMSENGTRFKESLVDLLSLQSIPEYKDIDTFNTSSVEEIETVQPKKTAIHKSKKKNIDSSKAAQEEIKTEIIDNNVAPKEEKKDEVNIDDLIDNPAAKELMKEALQKSYFGG